MTLKLIDTFSGIGGFSYAAEKLVGGFETVAFVECEPYCQKILKKHWPNVPIYDDIRTYNPKPYSASVICGGFPCQSISNAGKREGITETSQSGLWYELYRVICLLRPQYVVLENVSAILSNGLGIILGNLAEAGYCCEWCCIPASYVGACHQRDRIWIIAYPNKTRFQKEGAEQQATGVKQYRELGNVAYPTSVSDGSQIEIQARRNTTTRSSVADPSGDRLQGQIRPRPSRQTWSKKNSRRLNSNWRSYESEPVLRRGDDGLSNRVHRLKALGNSIVPQVAAIPLQRVLDIDRDV